MNADAARSSNPIRTAPRAAGAKKTPRGRGARGGEKSRAARSAARYWAKMYFAAWAFAREAALACTTPDLVALSIAAT